MAKRAPASLGTALQLIAVLLTSDFMAEEVEGIWMNLPASGTKCVSEEIHHNKIVVADYMIVSEDPYNGPTISIKVTSPFGNNLHQMDNVTHGHFSFTSAEAGTYVACLWIDNQNPGVGTIVNLEWKIGITARDWESVARKENIEGVELELRKLEGAVDAIHGNLLYLRSREAEMRTVSERTNARVAWFSIMSLGVCIVASCLQLWHLKRFFRKKKII
ncbi:hypothetical protein SAY87_007998 [Trapa incisa]|uniref:GOLD domain-containing protein n=1 Tax=Trapa incisa TaxID=236973 RepID=A0AAN7KLG3_9MYRT|nr:hypothetical protein SAY87_007998 [Trapa incisa]